MIQHAFKGAKLALADSYVLSGSNEVTDHSTSIQIFSGTLSPYPLLLEGVKIYLLASASGWDIAANSLQAAV